MNTNRLQLLRHSDILANYEALTRYLLTDYVKESLLAEPFVMFYQDGEEVRMVLAIGNPDAEYGCDIIDIKAVEAKIAELAEELGELTEEIARLAEAIEVIKADLAQEIADRIAADEAEAEARVKADEMLASLCGFVADERHSGELIYEPKNEILDGAKSLAEAIELVADYAVENNIIYTFEDSKSIHFEVEENERERIIKANVILSTEVRHDDNGDNYGLDDNILVEYADGLAANVNLEYNEEKGVLEFTKSSTKTGMHSHKEIKLPEAGISEAKAQALADKALEDAKAYTDNAVNDIIGHENAGVDEISLYGVRNRADAIEDKVNASVETAVEAEKTAREAEDAVLDAKIDAVLGHENAGVDEASVYGVRNRVDAIETKAEEAAEKALEDAKAYTDEAIANVDAAGAADKALADAKAYADEKDNAIKADLASEVERAKAAEKRALISEVKDGKGIDLTRSIEDNGTVLEAEVKLSGLNKNILSLKEDGLYAPEVQVEYDGVTNTITFKCGETETSYQLAGVQVVKDVRYDDKTNVLKFTFEDKDGNIFEVPVSLAGLVPSITSGSNEDSPVKIVITKDVDKTGQFIATVTAELNNVWDKDIKADFHVDTYDAEGAIIHTDTLTNVRQVLEHLLRRIDSVFESIRKFQSLSINGIKPYDDEHNGTMVLKGSDIKVGGNGEHSDDTIASAIEDLYENEAVTSEVKVKYGDDNEYLDLKVSEAEDGHTIYTLNGKVVTLAEASATKTGIADAKDVKDAIANAVETAIASGAEVKDNNDDYVDVTKSTDPVDNHSIYTVKPNIVKLEDATDDNTGIADAKDVKDAIAEAIESVISSGVEVKDDESKYVGVTKSTDPVDNHSIYTVEPNVVKLADVTDDTVALADVKDVKDAIGEAIEAAIASGSVVTKGNGIDVTSETAEDGHKIYTVSAKVDDASENYLSVSEDGLKVSGIDDKFSDLTVEDEVSANPEVVVKVSQADGKIDVEKRLLDGTIDNGVNGKSTIEFKITEDKITAEINLIDCGEY